MTSRSGLLVLTATALLACDLGEDQLREIPATPPVAKLTVMYHGKPSSQVSAWLSVPVSKVVDVDLFTGFVAKMTADEARQRLGPPTGEWDDPFCRARAPFYDRAGGRVAVCRYPTSGDDTWDVIAYPAYCTTGQGIHDARVLRQVQPWLPPKGSIDVHLVGVSGKDAVTVKMSRGGCEWVMLSNET